MSPTRRDVLRLGVLAGAGLVLEALPSGRVLRLASAGAADPGKAPFAPNPWLSIHPSGRVTVSCARAEMGQGVRTSLPMLVADELDVDWRKIVVVNAEPGPRYNEMRTSGSWSVGGAWLPLRRAGATARAMLIAAAAKRWGVPAAQCRTETGTVFHDRSKRSLPYGALAAEAARLQIPADVPLEPASRRRLIGRATSRHDGPAIVSGRAIYGIDIRVPDLLFASVERGPCIGARATSFDPAAARAIEGVRDVVRVPSGIAVVAASTWAAMRGRDALRVEWDRGARATFDSSAFRRELAEATRSAGVEARLEGDVPAAFANSARRLDALYEYAFQVHAPLEPMNCVARVGEDGCDVWLGTQAANQVHEAVAERLRLTPERVRIHPQLCGGGFGRRLGVDYALEAVEVARAVGAPVQVLWTRADDMRYGYYQPASAHRMSAALDAAGAPVAWTHTMAGVPHTAFGPPDSAGPELARDLMWGGFDNPYRVPAMRVAHVLLPAPVPTGPWRAVHYPPGLLARECFLDEIARAAGRDPVDLRLDLLTGGAPGGARERMSRVIRLVAEKSGWGQPLSSGRGRGIAANVYHGETTMAQVVEIAVASGGAVRVERVVCAVECGTVVNPLGLEAQIESAIAWGLTAALKGEIVFENGIASAGGYAEYPILGMSEMPRVEIHVVPSEAPPLGIGEQPVAPIAAAVNNAIFAATGRRVRRSPVRPEDLI